MLRQGLKGSITVRAVVSTCKMFYEGPYINPAAGTKHPVLQIGQTEAQRRGDTCSRSRSKSGAPSELGPRISASLSPGVTVTPDCLSDSEGCLSNTPPARRYKAGLSNKGGVEFQVQVQLSGQLKLQNSGWGGDFKCPAASH